MRNLSAIDRMEPRVLSSGKEYWYTAFQQEQMSKAHMDEKDVCKDPLQWPTAKLYNFMGRDTGGKGEYCTKKNFWVHKPKMEFKTGASLTLSHLPLDQWFPNWRHW